MRPAPPLIGVVHLGPLPGSPRYGGSLEPIIDAARRDALAYAAGRASGLIVENFHDVPFHRSRVEPTVVAAMTLAVEAVRRTVPLPLGVNVLRNDATSALAIAAVTGCGFIRVNMHSGAFVADQGIIQSAADETLRTRAALRAEAVGIWADVLVKHAAPLAAIDLVDAAEDLLLRELAEALIVTGRATGKPADPEDVRVLRERFPAAPIYVGSGVTPELAPRFLPAATGFIVGSWVKEDGQIEPPVDAAPVPRLLTALQAATHDTA